MIAGVDGCKGGWIVATAERWPTGDVRLSFFATFREVLERTAGCAAVAVDMPIGLPSGSEPRRCDLLAKERLGTAASRVFLCPPRETLAAKDPTEFQRLHRQYRGTGAGLPTWGIVPKIREVDAAITPALQKRIREFHPELTWQRLAGRTLSTKHRNAGLLERISLLEQHAPGIGARLAKEEALNFGKLDDILDAVVGLSAAEGMGQDRPDRSLPPGRSDRDPRGLRMEICF